MKHLHMSTLEKFVRSRLGRAQLIAVGRHLFVCSWCRTRLRHEVFGGAELLDRLIEKWPGGNLDQYQELFDRVEARMDERVRLAQQDQASATTLAREIEYRPSLIGGLKDGGERLQNPFLVERLLERAESFWGEDAERAETFARLGLDIASQLDTARYGYGLANDLQARSWAYIGNARRLAYDFMGAEAAVAVAEALLSQGSHEPLERARVFHIKASLLGEERRFGTALRVIQNVAAIYRQVRDPHLEGRALSSEAIYHNATGATQTAYDTHFRAIRQIDEAREPRLAFIARQNLALHFAEGGCAHKAAALLPDLRLTSARYGRSLEHKFRGVAGSVEREIGLLVEAETDLTASLNYFIKQRDGFVAALISLELAKLYIMQGGTTAIRSLGDRMQSILLDKNFQRQAINPFLQFQQAALQGTATVRLVQATIPLVKEAQARALARPEYPS